MKFWMTLKINSTGTSVSDFSKTADLRTILEKSEVPKQMLGPQHESSFPRHS